MAVEASNSSSPGTRRMHANGDILVEAGKLGKTDVEQIQGFATEMDLQFGDAALQMKRINPEPTIFENTVSEVVIAAHNPRCAAVEELRTVRSRLVLGWLKGAERNVLAITSAERGEGRSWFAANLAMVFAQTGLRTLLLDADMRHPQQHRLFNLPSNVGLSGLLSKLAGKEVIHRVHPDSRLFVVPAGALPPNPQELIMQELFDAVLGRMAKQFDLVVLDTPAAAETADAEILAAKAGAAIMLTRKNRTRNSSLLAAMECLTRSGVKVIGSVLNDY
jgi:protein-tyrosine kinase